VNLTNKINKLRPKVSLREFTLVDDSDGKGPYISRWESSETKPTQAELDSVDDSPAIWIAAQNEIERLEALETPRRLAESVLSDDGKAWLTANREKIVIERAKL